MSYDPKDNKQTHDTMGRQFTEPQDGGPVPDRVNLIVGEDSAMGETSITVQRNDQDTNLFLGPLDDDIDIKEILEPLTDQMEPYFANLAYYKWYDAYVGEMSFEDAMIWVEGLLCEKDLDYETM